MTLFGVALKQQLCGLIKIWSGWVAERCVVCSSLKGDFSKLLPLAADLQVSGNITVYKT